MIKVIHLVPSDVIGGVEVAAKSLKFFMSQDLFLEVQYVNDSPMAFGSSGWLTRLLSIAYAVKRIYQKKCDVLIVSLWQSAVVGIILKLINPKIKLIFFSHSTKSVNYVDFLIAKISVFLSYQVWGDSKSSLYLRFPKLDFNKFRIISFVLQKFTSQGQLLQPRFIYWGRLSFQKGLDRAILIFNEIYKSTPDAHFLIIGPDAGAYRHLRQLCENLGLCDAVEMIGAVDHELIVNYAGSASFFLQTSPQEGFSIAVVEAMQMGLVPVVTPVGEIKNYCHPKLNAIFVESDTEAIKEVLSVLSDAQKYHKLQKSAIQTWHDYPLYKESILEACMQV